MRVDSRTAIALAIVLIVIFVLAGWGHLLGLDPDVLAKLRLGAETLGAVVLACLGALLRKDDNGNGVPDVLDPPPTQSRRPSRRPGEPFPRLALVLAAFLAACGPGAAQAALSGQAAVLVATRPARLDFYDRAHDRCLADTAGLQAYRECMIPAQAVARAADSYRDTLQAAQAVIDATGADSAMGAIACAVLAARRLVEASEAASAPIPAEVLSVARMVPEGVCDGR